MRSFAEYIMRGRFQAYSIALLGGLFLLFGQSAIGLVSLRRGWQEGCFVVLWGCLPFLAQMWLGQIGAMWTYMCIAVLVVTYLSALILRMTTSWGVTLIAMTAISAIGAFVVYVTLGDFLEEVRNSLRAVIAETEAGAKLIELMTQSSSKVLGGIAAWIGLASIMGLLVARWLQAKLYNPGGFREEFHALRLSKYSASICAVGLAVSYYAGAQYEFWGLLFSLPLFFAGLGLMHHLVKQYNMGLAPLVVLYTSIVLIGLPAVIVVVFGLTDAWMNYRKILVKSGD